MKGAKNQRSPKRKTSKPTEQERKDEYGAVIDPDPLLREVGEANEHIAEPSERERVIPSRPC